MLLKKSGEISSGEITDEKDYLNRRNFIRGGLLAGTAAATTLLYRRLAVPAGSLAAGMAEGVPEGAVYSTNTGESATAFADISSYNNFYEFSTSKEGVASRAESFVTRPWTVEIGGLVHKPRTFDLDELIRLGVEERVYRFRCVEAWSMVIPWLGMSRCQPRATSHSRHCLIRRGCPISERVFWSGRTSKDCDLTRR